MPEQFLALTRAAAVPAAPPPPHAAAYMPPASPAAAPVGIARAASAPAGVPGPSPKATGVRRSLLIGGIIAGAVLVLGGAAAFFVLRSLPEEPTPAPAANVAPSVNAAPVNEPTPPPAPEPAPPPEPEPAPQPPAPSPQLPDVDTDGDGLTDAEEVILGTNVFSRDTDGDSYDDRTEVVNLYNPLAVAPQRLIDSGAVFAYAHPTDAWEVYLPKSWTVAATDQEQKTVRIATGVESEFIQFEVIPNPDERSLLDAVVLLTPSLVSPDPNDLETFTSKRGESGIRAVRHVGLGDTWFALGTNRVLMVRHLLQPVDGRYQAVRYSTLFEMVVQSFSGPPRGGPIE